jgi:DNA-binding NarL/FixJ family response regulator
VKIKVFIVEDHTTVRQGIVETINREATLCVCGEADDVHPADREDGNFELGIYFELSALNFELPPFLNAGP